MNYIKNLRDDNSITSISLIIAAGIILFIFTYTISYYNFRYLGSTIENLAVLTSYICTLLVVFEKRINFLFAIVSTILFTLVFIEQKLFSSAILNVFFLFISIYGIYSWKHSKIDTKLNLIPIFFIITIVTIIPYYYLMIYLNSSNTILDEAILFLSIFANLLMIKKVIWHWLIWIIVNIISIYVYYKSGLYVVAIQYMYFLINAFLGLYIWKLKEIK